MTGGGRRLTFQNDSRNDFLWRFHGQNTQNLGKIEIIRPKRDKIDLTN